MSQYNLSQNRLEGALFGMFIGDALAMPAHWYYNTSTLKRDYGQISTYLAPKNPHPDSIVWRSSYTPPNKSADILHDQAQYWGRKGIHYHQFLHAGENTLNIKLARELLLFLQQPGTYSRRFWLERFIGFMTTASNHNDTYVEEYLRHFFTNFGHGKDPLECGSQDEKHIGGLALILPLVIVFAEDPRYAKEIALQHLSLTHGGVNIKKWAEIIIDTLLGILHGESLSQSIKHATKEKSSTVNADDFEAFARYADTTVVGKHFSSACYVEHAVPATLFLALKYQDSPKKGLISNTMCGGDNCGRGAVLGALLGALNGMQGWPPNWVDGLTHPPPFIRLTGEYNGLMLHQCSE